MTDAKVLETADMLARTWYEAAAVTGIIGEDLTNIAITAAANVAWASHGIGGIEMLRLAADAMERGVMSSGDRDDGARA